LENAIFDYTNPEVREWWAGLFKELISDIGVKRVWNDMRMSLPVMEVPNKRSNGCSSIMTETCSHRKAHNIANFRWQEPLIMV
jgi:alpha-glucosidase